MAKVLVIDDDAAICRTLSELVRRMGHDADYALTLQDGLRLALSEAYDVVFLDVRMPDGSGLDIIADIRDTSAAPEVMIMTGYGDKDGAEIAIRNGAWDYLQKPIYPKEIMLPLNRVFQYRDNLTKVKASPAVLNTEGIIGSSPRIRSCIDLMAQAAGSTANVLITGETGTGKELFARATHFNSARRRHSFVVVDCAALPENLVESALFGHEKGAFTGANRAQEGLIRQAHQGTLFLDEVGELPLSMQRAFLRVLQERRFRPVGGKKEVESDFRLLAATNRNLDQMVRAGQFREDLFYRLRSLTLDIPPLRKRREDIRELTLHCMNRICERYGTEMKGFSTDFFEALASYHWPGNVRELHQTLENVFTKARQEPTLFPKHLPDVIRVQFARASVPPPSSAAVPEPEPSETDREQMPKLRDYLEHHEQQYMKELMAATGGDIQTACRVSGLSRTRLYARLKKYSIARKN